MVKGTEHLTVISDNHLFNMITVELDTKIELFLFGSWYVFDLIESYLFFTPIRCGKGIITWLGGDGRKTKKKVGIHLSINWVQVFSSNYIRTIDVTFSWSLQKMSNFKPSILWIHGFRDLREARVCIMYTHIILISIFQNFEQILKK